jgi:hypothetical protein
MTEHPLIGSTTDLTAEDGEAVTPYEVISVELSGEPGIGYLIGFQSLQEGFDDPPEQRTIPFKDIPRSTHWRLHYTSMVGDVKRALRIMRNAEGLV